LNRSLIEAAGRKKWRLRSFFGMTSEFAELLRTALTQMWVPINGGHPPSSVVGVDGSLVSLDLRNMLIYAVTSVAVGFRRVGNGYSESEPIELADIDVVIGKEMESVTHLAREILEVKALREAIIRQDPSLVLVDGSLLAILMRPAPVLGRASLREMAAQFRESTGIDPLELVEQGLREEVGRDSILRQRPLLVIDSVNPHALSEELIKPVLLFTYLEKLAALRQALDEAWRRGATVAYVAKRGISSHFYDRYVRRLLKETIETPRARRLSDITFFDLADTPGYAVLPPQHGGGVHVEGATEHAAEPPRELGLLDFYRGVNIAITYVKLSPTAPALRVEIPLRGGDPEEVVEDVVEAMLTLSPEGYPYPLTVADAHCRIRHEDLRRVLDFLGIGPRLTGREGMGVWLKT